jgi:accessory colonization factor AcfC
MTVQQRMSGFGKVNMAQIILIIVSIVGAVTLAIMLLNMYGGGGTETIVKEVGKTVVNNSSAIKG